MPDSIEQILRVADWRVKGLKTRLAQCTLVAVLAYGGSKSELVAVWYAVTMLIGVADAWVFRHLRRHADHSLSRRLALVSLLVSSLSFAVIGPLLYLNPSVVTEIGASLLMCAISLNNTVMTRGWRAATYVVVGAVAATMLLGTPLALMARHVTTSSLDMLVLASASVSYLAFIAILITTLQRESDAVRSARARWRSLFEQNPLPQICLDAAGLSQMLGHVPQDDNLALADAFQRTVTRMEMLTDAIRITDINRAALRLLGTDAADRFRMDRHFDETFIQGFVESRRRPRTDDGFEPFECPLTRGDGSIRTVRAHLHTVELGNRRWATVVMTLEDITELQRADAAQQQALAAAEEANRAKSDFLATMSHEIRTPLNGVLGMVQALERGSLTDDQRRQLAVIGRSGSALLVILNDILDLSKIEAGRLELDVAPFDLELLIDDVVDTFGEIAASKGLALTGHIGPGAAGTYLGDAVRIRQILSNLVANAVKFTAAGEVTVSATTDGTKLSLVVSDTGIGLSDDRIEPLFDKFTQLDQTTTRRYGGTGLGLAICRELAQALGGEIRGHGTPGVGSRFTFEVSLPRIAGTALPAPPPPLDPPLPDPIRGDRTLRILAAEDNPMNQTVLRTLLQQAGLDVVMVSDGSEAVAAWDSSTWDVILMDVQMPVMDGPAAAREIRRREAETGRAATPIVAVTANAMAHQVEAYRSAGMAHLVAKPIEVRALLRAIQAAADTRPAALPAAADQGWRNADFPATS